MTAIVFDLDGTLIDSAPDIRAAANDVLEAEGHAPLTLPETRGFIGRGAAVFVQRMRAARGIGPARQADMLAAFEARYLTAVELTRLYPGARPALEALIAGGTRIGICTNKPLAATHAILTHLAIDGLFGAVIGGDSLPSRKPDPAPLHAAFRALDASSGLFVGDSEIDAQTARAAAIPFALFTEGYRQGPVADLPHDWQFSRYDQLAAIAAAAR
ncbi:phosphoglycolate phosphatase [Profundibacterium mesophilum]|uniref:Phosphoglycolate phosphatase n=1 Tax=Profundibacterium mesophilum KAUST100406-0324 TaxID=1037889 RepID=A0A921NPN6_9RHOB|nr:phosphoglycolate phosphatase [Profundibacterium mesophilum]KAF0674582.1 Phosphoglycolate phosphatase [Profundibacterium mesophilum KAUST100406-0324]